MVMCEYVEPNSSKIKSLVARLYDVIPDNSMIVVLSDHAGRLWASHPQEVEALNIESEQWQDIMERLDDGDDPVVVSTNDVHIVGAQFSEKRLDYPYVMVLLSRRSSDVLLQQMGLVEMIINQIDLMMAYADCELACV